MSLNAWQDGDVNLDKPNTEAASMMKGPHMGSSKEDWKPPTFIPWGSQKRV